jgi:uncharacterized membrane protein
MIPGGLLIVALIPAITGTASLTFTAQSLAAGEDGSAMDVARYVEHPVMIATHVIGGVTFSLFGILQIMPRFRNANLARHRAIGRVLVVLAALSGLSALWMNAVFPTPGGDVQRWVAAVFGVAMLVALALSMRAIRQRRIGDHRAWMLRAYAIALGAGTQRVMLVPVMIASGGELGQTAIVIGVTAGWGLNLAIAEWAIRAPKAHPGAARARAV